MAAKILIIEDESALVVLLRYNLEAEGHRVSVAMTGEEAKLVLDEERPDLVILDWMLPGPVGHRDLPPDPAPAGDTRHSRSSCSRRAARRATASAASPPARTTTWSSRSRSPS